MQETIQKNYYLVVFQSVRIRKGRVMQYVLVAVEQLNQAIVKWRAQIRFFLSGILSDIVYYVFYIFGPMVYGPHYLFASLTGFIAYWGMNFFLMRTWTFKSTGNARKEMGQHLLLHIGCQTLSMCGLYILIEKFGWHYILAQVPMALMYFCINYFFSVKIFRNDSTKD